MSSFQSCTITEWSDWSACDVSMYAFDNWVHIQVNAHDATQQDIHTKFPLRCFDPTAADPASTVTASLSDCSVRPQDAIDASPHIVCRDGSVDRARKQVRMRDVVQHALNSRPCPVSNKQVRDCPPFPPRDDIPLCPVAHSS